MVSRTSEETVCQSHHQPMPKALPLDHPACTQDGMLAMTPFIAWPPRALKEALGPLSSCGEFLLYLWGGLRGTQGTPLHTGFLEGLSQGLHPLGGKVHTFI